MAASSKGGRPPKYPWRTMAIGESFISFSSHQNSLCQAARLYHAPRKFKTKKVLLKGVQGVRVWRVA